MRLLYAIVLSACLLPAAPSVVYAGPEEEAYAAVEKWAEAVDSHVAKDIVKLYEHPPILMFLGTLNNARVRDEAGLVAYFTDLVKKDPRVALCQHAAIKVSDRAVLVAGLYDFTLKGTIVPAHYSFLMLKRGDGWLIAHHLSSERPKDLPCGTL